MGAAEAIEQVIRDLEAEQERTALVLADLRVALAKARNGAVAPLPAATSPKPSHPVFQKKYEKNARELILAVLRGSRRALHVGQIQDALKAQNFEFIKATISLNLKHLQEEGLARRVKAQSGSGFTWAWLIAEKETLAEELRSSN